MFLDYSHTFNKTNTKTLKVFFVKTIRRENITWVLMNNYRFPTSHPHYIYWADPNRELLDIFEEAIENAGPYYVVVHYTVDQNWCIKSSKGHTFEQIMQR